MKKLSFIVMACLLVLGLTQCKKNEPTNNNNDDNRVSITLKLENGGQRVHPEEENGLANIVYDNGDVVYVGSDGKYMGTLTYNGSLFTGSINAAATVGQPLQFIFMGGKDFSNSLTENSSTEFVFNIGDQSNGLAVISCAASNEDFSSTNLSYTAYLRNKCALVKFGMGNVSTNAEITLSGLKNTATIGFDGTVTNGTTTGDIVTYGTGLTRYAVVLSDQCTVTDGTISAEGYEGTFSIPTAAYTNAFLTDASMTLTATGPTNPEGSINGLFSVSSTKQVYFSQGNLQYIGSATPAYWKFAENQWDYLGNNGQGSDSQAVDRDLFGWGTSGYDHGATCYQPWSTHSSDMRYYAYGSSTKNLYDAKDDGLMQGQADWGYNAISNGGNTEGQWRTLTKDEWNYVFNTRTPESGIRYAKATVNGVTGVILLPDGWASSTYPLNTSNANFTSNSITATDWTSTLEANGAVFLPAAGYRYSTSSPQNMGTRGYYWSSSYYDDNHAYCETFFEASTLYSYGNDRYYGCSVRLVRDAE